MRILIVEDDQLLGDGIQAGLTQEGYTVDWVLDGLMAKDAIIDSTFDAVILDLGLPKLSGLEVLTAIRKKKYSVPVLILTANDSMADRVKALDLGADDYMTKPFDFNEISARLRALLRRSVGRASPNIQHGDITINPASHEVTLKGQLVKLSRREFALLETLIESAGRVISRDQMVDVLYGWNDEIDSNALEVHIHNLRKKFGTKLIKTIRGVGYIVQKESQNVNG